MRYGDDWTDFKNKYFLAQIEATSNDYTFEDRFSPKNHNQPVLTRVPCGMFHVFTKPSAARFMMGGGDSDRYSTRNTDDAKEASQSAVRRVWEHRDWMTTVLAARTGGRWDVAEEIWADLMVSFVEKPQVLDDAVHVRPWLYQMAVHKAADWVRRQVREAGRFHASGSELLASDLVPSTELPPLELLLSAERSADLRQTLGRLPAEDQEVLYLK